MHSGTVHGCWLDVCVIQRWQVLNSAEVPVQLEGKVITKINGLTVTGWEQATQQLQVMGPPAAARQLTVLAGAASDG